MTSTRHLSRDSRHPDPISSAPGSWFLTDLCSCSSADPYFGFLSDLLRNLCQHEHSTKTQTPQAKRGACSAKPTSLSFAPSFRCLSFHSF